MKNQLQFLGAVIIPQVFALMTLILLTRELSLSDYASIAILEALLMLLTPLISLGVDRAAAKYSTTLNLKLVHEVGNGIIATSCIALFFPYLSIYFLLDLGEVFKIDLFDYIAIFIVGYSYNLITLLQVKNQFSGELLNYLITAVIKTFFPMIFISIGILLLNLGDKSFIYGMLTGSIVLIFYSNSKGSLALRFWKKDWDLGRSMLTYGLPLIPAFISGWVVSWSNRFFLNAYVTQEELGIYSAVFKYSMVFFLFVQAANLYLTPFIYRLLEAKKYRKVEHYLMMSVFLFLFGAFGFTILIALFLPYFGVSSSIEIIVGVGIINYISGIAGITTQLLLLFYKKTKELMYGSVFYAAICVVLYWILIPQLQIFGLLFSNLVCIALSNLVFLKIMNGSITLRKFNFLYLLLNFVVIFMSIALFMMNF